MYRLTNESKCKAQLSACKTNGAKMNSIGFKAEDDVKCKKEKKGVTCLAQSAKVNGTVFYCSVCSPSEAACVVCALFDN